MKNKDDRRLFDRIKNDAPIVFAYHNTDHFYHAEMCDYSNAGMCFVTPDGVDPGSDIYIMMENFSADAIHAEFYEGFFAEVKWCQPMLAEEVSTYRVGVKYYKTTID
ncbi:MAG: PilZ domain-containing protein [Desulfobacterales bacterium]|nr:PilZ domain-containing protein [Desulfobacterales bacterium]